MPEPTSDDLSIGERIARYRRALGLTQEGLAMRLFRSKSWVTKVERGERPLDSVRTLLEVARALGGGPRPDGPSVVPGAWRPWP